jgi:multisubunit Na+/H+ antiporter MnhG subunit
VFVIALLNPVFQHIAAAAAYASLLNTRATERNGKK